MDLRFKSLVVMCTIMSTLVAGEYFMSPPAVVPPNDPQNSCPVTPATFASWFKTGQVTPNGLVTPANSLLNLNPNCGFYSWSERMFLWLTSPSSGIYGNTGHVFDSNFFYDVSPADSAGNRHFIAHTPGMIHNMSVRAAQMGAHHLPLIRSKSGALFEVENTSTSAQKRPIVLDATNKRVEVSKLTVKANAVELTDQAGHKVNGAKALLRAGLNPARTVEKLTVGKTTLFIDGNGRKVDVDPEAGQAGGSGVLMAQNGSLIYYTTMVNNVYAYFATGTRKGAIKTNTFPTTITDLKNVVKYANSNGVTTVPDAQALAIELKASWIEAATLPGKGAGYVTMTALIPVYTHKNDSTWVPSGTSKKALMAMVGFHVVGSTSGHPEMIWATFEHQDNTPNAAFAYVNASGQTVQVPASTAGPWTFCKAGAPGPYANPPFNTERMKYASNTGSSTGAAKGNIVALTGKTIGSSNILRTTPWGAASDKSPNPVDATPAISNSEIISMNNSIRGQLKAGDVRHGYLLIGATWTIGGDSPIGPYNGSSSANGIEVGTSQLANSTMETYHQNVTTLFSATSNCFNCHQSTSGTGHLADTNVSHVFSALKPLKGWH